MSTPVHIYVLSQLVHATPATWERHIQDLEDSKRVAYRYYAPLRQAAVAVSRSGLKGVDQLREQLRIGASGIPAGRNTNPVKDNVTAFDNFVENFYPKILEFHQSFLREVSSCDFEGVRLLGLPHFSVSDSRRAQRYVHLHASKWHEEDLKAYLELLSVATEKRFKEPPEAIWCMDLRTGKDIKWRSSSRMRTRCGNAARHYARLMRVTA